MFRLNAAQKALISILLLVWAFINLFPVGIMLLSGFKETREIFQNPFGLPESWSFANHVEAWTKANFAGYFVNSVIVTAFSITAIIFVSSMAAYVIARYRFPGRRFVYLFLISGLALPVRLAIIPIFLMVRSLGIQDTLFSLIVVYTAGGIAFSMFLLTNFFKSIPGDFHDSARIDGAGDFRVYRSIYLPLLRPALATVAVFNFINVWNDFFFPLIFINSESRMTIPLGIQAFFGEYTVKWDLLFSALTIAVVPMILFFLVMSRQFISGLTEGAIK